MKLILALLVLIASNAFAYQPNQNIANMHAHCQCVMQAGVCGGYNQASLSSMPAEKAGIPKLLGVTLGVVTRGEWHTWNANPLMCEQLVADCSADWWGPGCRIARSQFVQDVEFPCGESEKSSATAEAGSDKITFATMAAIASLMLVSSRRRREAVSARLAEQRRTR